MSQPEIYVLLLGIIACIGIIGSNLTVPMPLLLVIAGMLISYVPGFPLIELHPDIVFDIFLPLLVYESSAFMSWREVLKYKRPVALLSIGHVVFITIIVAVTAHYMIPAITWPMAFVLGAVISPPDDIAIFAIADKIHLPQRIMTILSAESLLNDATALILFRLALTAVITHTFSIWHALSGFCAIVVLETLYGLAVGHLIGQLRLRLRTPMIQMLSSILTPFVAYLPAVHFGGSGVLAAVVAGLVIGHSYLYRFPPGSRLLWRSVWETITYLVTSILFLLVGLNLRNTLANISIVPLTQLLWYGMVITFVVIAGRFIWVYSGTYIPRYLFPKRRKNAGYPPWRYPFIISWAGMRGAVSLAAALVVPPLVMQVNGVDLRNILVFLVFCIITATLLIQGLTLPWIIKILGIDKIGKHEKLHEQFDELSARLELIRSTLAWLHEYKKTLHAKTDALLKEEVDIQILEYQAIKKRIEESIQTCEHHVDITKPSQYKLASELYIQIIDVEKETLTRLWHGRKISLSIRNKLLLYLDLKAKRYYE